MNNDLISREALKEAMRKAKRGHYAAFSDVTLQDIYRVIDNAPTVFDDKAYSDGYAQGTCDCEHAHERPQGDLISRSELKKCAIPCQIHNGALTDLCVPLYQIDNAPDS